MDVVIRSIRSRAVQSNFTVQSLQKAYLQMNLAQLMDTAYEARKQSGGVLNSTRHAEELYREWNANAKAAGHNPVEWTEEVRLGRRWMHWSKMLSEETDGLSYNLGPLLALSGFKMASGGSAVSFLRRKINNAEMFYAEVYFSRYCSKMKALSKILDDVAKKLITGEVITEEDVETVGKVITKQIIVGRPCIKTEPDEGDVSALSLISGSEESEEGEDEEGSEEE
ncbi:hypothetical protein EAE96_003487 [Botrytis aclada]|nr:hypothetical protein EAE96_003487 [Botrytis aclada]